MNEKKILEVLEKNNQKKLLNYLNNLKDYEREKLLKELEELNIESYFSILNKNNKSATFSFDKIEKPFVFEQGKFDIEKYRKEGEKALSNGEVAFFVVAGGQGSRLGFEHPKGLFPISPILQKSLFQIHAEKVSAFGNLYGFSPEFFIMTSSTNHDETVEFFNKFGKEWIDLNNVHFFKQRDLPSVDMEGNLILSDRLTPFKAPDGHGGALLALKNSGMIDLMKKKGIKHLSYFQVDNPLVNIADPVFLGLHILEKSEVSSKVLPKRSYDEKVGVAAIVDGKPAIIEYSDLSDDLAKKRDIDGRLLFNFGSIAIHIFSVDFIDRITTDKLQLPYHVAKKKIPYFDYETSTIKNPEKPNGIKLEQFVFDSIPMSKNAIFYETIREIEFSPLKNKEGEDSIQTCKEGISNLFKIWLKKSGVIFDDEKNCIVEISPSFAVNMDQLKEKINNYIKKVPKKLYLE
ncbi:MAG TPA: UDPGP type 1 family protein [Exilispira sp.]|nr:UDPGP type 1 family protein [Exilispira sp.]